MDAPGKTIDHNLIMQAIQLADGTDIHRIAGMVQMYRGAAKDGSAAAISEFERALREYVGRKRLQQLPSGPMGDAARNATEHR